MTNGVSQKAGNVSKRIRHEGWYLPQGKKRAHYYRKPQSMSVGGRKSLCGLSAYFGPPINLEPDREYPRPCRSCKWIRDKETKQ
jgi:hypothetical protein